MANVEGVLKQSLRTHVTAAELYYLRHLRSCAASAFGHRSTSTGTTVELCTPGVSVLLEIGISLFMEVLQSMSSMLEFLMYMSMAMLQRMLRMLELVIFRFVALLQSTPSPLEIGACICVVDAIESKCQGVHIVTAILILFLAGCEWHVPSRVPHYYNACRLLSAMAMQTLFPFAITAICLAFLDPTFGKKSSHN